VGLRDPDIGGKFTVPGTPLLQQRHDLRNRVRKHNVGDVSRGRYHRELLLRAGFLRARAMASDTSAGSPEETRRAAAFEKAQLEGLARTALAEGWLDQTEVDAMGREIVAWRERRTRSSPAFGAKPSPGWTRKTRSVGSMGKVRVGRPISAAKCRSNL
jgi:hypothetical protein